MVCAGGVQLRNIFYTVFHMMLRAAAGVLCPRKNPQQAWCLRRQVRCA